jgi:riboflavin synthase
MFTGIVQKLVPVASVERQPHLLKYAIQLDDCANLELGASIAVDGVCQTVVKIDGGHVWFDAIEETLQKTTLKHVTSGLRVNVERAARFGDEIGGHQVSGHVYGTAKIVDIKDNQYTFQLPTEWMKYFFKKGYIAIDGVSLTIVDAHRDGKLTVHLIPETLARTTLGFKKVGDLVNIEIDAQTQVIVETIERVLKNR